MYSLLKFIFLACFSLLLIACGSGSGGGAEDSSSQSDTNSSPPIVDLKINIPETIGQYAFLDATGSYDPDGAEIVNYELMQLSGDHIDIIQSGNGVMSFVMPDISQPIQFLLILTSSDGDTAAYLVYVFPVGSSLTPTDGVYLPIVSNFAPVIQITTRSPSAVGDIGRIDAQSSYDPENRPLSYSFVQIDGPAVTLTEEQAGLMSFISPALATTQAARFRVTIEDVEGLIAVDEIRINLPASRPPVVIVSQSVPGMAGQQASIDARSSYDPQGSDLLYTFQQIYGTPVVINETEPGLVQFTVPPVTSTSSIGVRVTVENDLGVVRSSDVSLSLPGIINPGTSVFRINNTMSIGDLTQEYPINWQGPGLSIDLGTSDNNLDAEIVGDLEAGTARLRINANLQALSSVTPRAYYATYLYSSTSLDFTYNAETVNRSINSTLVVSDSVSEIIPGIVFSVVSGSSIIPDQVNILFNGSALSGNYSNAINYTETPLSPWLNATLNAGGSGYSAEVISTDLPAGTYHAILTLSSANNVLIPVSVTLNVADIDIQVDSLLTVTLDQLSDSSVFTTPADVIPNSESVVWSVESETPWITVNRNGGASSVEITLDDTEVTQFANGTYTGSILYTYSGPHTPEQTKRTTVNIDMAMAQVNYVTPKVAYTSDTTHVIIKGDNFNFQLGDVIEVGGTIVELFTQVSTNEIEFDLPGGIAAGEHEITFSNGLGVTTIGTSIFVKSHPVFPTGRITMPQRAASVEYDARREKLYVLYSQIIELTFQTNTWQWQEIPAGGPSAMTMTHDGDELLVTQSGCMVLHVNLDTKAISQPYGAKASCYYDYLGAIEAMYDGEILVADTNQWPTIWTYPGWGSHSYVSEHSPRVLANRNDTHMIWAGGPTISGARRAYVYNARNDSFQMLGTVGGDHYLKSSFSISSDASRISHYSDIYNDQFEYLGRIGASTLSSLDRTGLSPDGNLAAQFIYSTKEVKFYDISTTAPFAEVGNAISLSPTDVSIVDRIEFSDDSRYVFIFTHNTSTSISYMYVEQVGL